MDLNVIRAEIERRLKETKEKENHFFDVKDDEDGIYYSGAEGAYKELLSFLDTLEQEPTPKIHGWVARDSYEDVFNGCGLILHHSKPWREGMEWSHQTIAMHLPWSMFPDLKWKDEPVEVELEIHRV